MQTQFRSNPIITKKPNRSNQSANQAANQAPNHQLQMPFSHSTKSTTTTTAAHKTSNATTATTTNGKNVYQF